MTRHKLFIVIILLFVAGCATLKEKKKMDSFEQDLRSYELAIVWGQYEAADSFRIKENEAEVVDFQKLRQFNVSSYELLKSYFMENKSVAHQKVEIKYYNINNLIERTIIDLQVWEYDETAKRWRLKTGLPDFR